MTRPTHRALQRAWMSIGLSLACADAEHATPIGDGGRPASPMDAGSLRDAARSAADTGVVVSDGAPDRVMLDGAVRDEQSGVPPADAESDADVADAASPAPPHCSMSASSQLTDDATDKPSLAAAAVGGGVSLAWVADDSIVLAESLARGLGRVAIVDVLDLSNSFDPRVLLTGGEDVGSLFVSDASRLRGVELTSAVEFGQTPFDIALPLVDARAVWLGERAAVFGLDVFQGCGLFVRAALLSDGEEPETSMSECLVNFSGALSDVAVLDDQAHVLVGERLMRFDARTSEYEEHPLTGSAHRWQHTAVLAWGAERGVLVTGHQGVSTQVEALDEVGQVLRRLEIPGRSVVPWAIDETTRDGVYRWVGVRGQAPDTELVLTIVNEQPDLLLPPFPVADVTDPTDVRLVTLDDVSRVFWLDEIDGVSQVFTADVSCTAE